MALVRGGAIDPLCPPPPGSDSYRREAGTSRSTRQFELCGSEASILSVDVAGGVEQKDPVVDDIDGVEQPTTVVMAVPMGTFLAVASQGRREGIDEGVIPHSSCDLSTSRREGIDEGVFPHLSCDHSTSFPRVPTYLWYWETDAWKIKPSTAMCGTILEAFSSGRVVKPPPPR
jgi:hypothetical protein